MKLRDPAPETYSKQALDDYLSDKIKPRCESMGYNLAASGEVKKLPGDDLNLKYGSANLKG